ncbi:hypothetical protein ACPCG0_10665 [Propionibacteriaceae bacterium Y1923]
MLLVPQAVIGGALLVMVVFGVVVFGATIWGVLALARMNERQQRQLDSLWAGWARARGWGYREQWPQMVDRFKGPPFGTGSQRKANRGFWGRFDNVDVFGFQYSYLVQSGKNSHTVQQQVCGVRFPGAKFPPVRVTPETLFNAGKDIDFENHAFNAFFHVTSPSPRFAHDVLHPRAIELLMRTSPASVLWLEGDALLSSITGERTPAQVDAQLRQLTEFAGLLPNFLLNLVGGVPVSPDLSGPGVSHEEQHRRMLSWWHRPQLPPPPHGASQGW